MQCTWHTTQYTVPGLQFFCAVHYISVHLANTVPGCRYGVQCFTWLTLYLGYSFFVQSCTWQRLRHAGCKGTEHPQANLLLVIIIIVIVIILIMIVTVTVIMMIMISMIQMLMIQAFMESILTHMCCSQIAEASCSEEHVIKSSKKAPPREMSTLPGGLSLGFSSPHFWFSAAK